MRTRLLYLLLAFLICAAFIATAHAQSTAGPILSGAMTGNGYGKGGKPKPTPTPSPSPVPKPSATPHDGQTNWTGAANSDFNTLTNWSPSTGSAPPAPGDVTWFTSSPSNKNVNLSSAVSIAGLYFNGTGASGYNLTNSSGAAFTLTASGTTIGIEQSDTTAVAIGAENTSGTNTISAPIVLAPTTGTSTIYQAPGGTLILSGNISGPSIGLSKTGDGTVILSGTNNYTGATTVSAGKLFVNGNNSAATGTVTVSNSGTVLGGTGTIGGPVSIASSGAILEAGTGSTNQTLTIKGSLTMASGSIIELALGASGAHSTLALTSATASSFWSTQHFSFINLGAAAGTYQDIITGVTSNPFSTDTFVIDNAGWAGTFSWDSSDNGIDLSLTAVPEPSTWFAAGLAVVGVGYTLRRRFARVFARV